MAIRKANAEWKGDLFNGAGTLALGSGAYNGSYAFKSRMEEGTGTNPEELFAAALSGCYSMALSAGLAAAGHTPESVRTQAFVHFDKVGEGFAITKIDLDVEASIPGIDQATFQRFAADAKVNCPVSRALSATPIELTAKLV